MTARSVLEPLEVTLEVPLNRLLKAPEKAKLISSIVQEFKTNKVASCSVQDVQYIDRRSELAQNDPVLSIQISLVLQAATIQLIQSLDTLIRDGNAAGRQLIVYVGSIRIVNQEGKLFSDDEIVKMIWVGRHKEHDVSRIGVVYGLIRYLSWSKDPIPVAITITNSDVIRRILDGQYRFLLAEARVKWICCSICSENFENCEHKEGENYNTKICTPIPRAVQFVEGSIVNSGLDSRCKIIDLLLVDNTRSVFEWCAFEKVNMMDRTRRINDAQKDVLIPREAANKFRVYFSSRSVGRSRYRAGMVKGGATSHRKAIKV